MQRFDDEAIFGGKNNGAKIDDENCVRKIACWMEQFDTTSQMHETLPDAYWILVLVQSILAEAIFPDQFPKHIFQKWVKGQRTGWRGRCSGRWLRGRPGHPPPIPSESATRIQSRWGGGGQPKKDKVWISAPSPLLRVGGGKKICRWGPQKCNAKRTNKAWK